MKIEQENYCRECGRELIRVPIPAEKAKIMIAPDCDIELGSRFNKITGKRQFGVKVFCVKKRWWNWHTSYIDENSLHDSDLPELLKL